MTPTSINRMKLLLDALVLCPSIAAAARSVGMSSRNHYHYQIRSRQNDPEMTFEWMGVTCSYAQHYENSKALAASAIEANALDRAANAMEVPSLWQGDYVYMRNEDYLDWEDGDFKTFDVSLRDKWLWEADPDRPGHQRRKRVMVPLKVDTALTVKMLESWGKRYKQKSEITMTNTTTLRLERSDERKTVDVTPVVTSFEEIDQDENKPALALGRPAASTEEMDAWVAAGEAEHDAVTFEDEHGVETVLVPDADPLAIAPTDRPDVVALKKQAAEAIARARAAAPARPPRVEIFGTGREGDYEVHDTGDTGDTGKPEPERRTKMC